VSHKGSIGVCGGNIGRVLAALRVESHTIEDTPLASEPDILGTTVMASDAGSSVVDDRLVHHGARNLLVLGGGAFSTAAPVNPTLTLCAPSPRATGNLLGPGPVSEIAA
jgi:choline dehydrogenase-like flavoprotein